jgi:hypothetical protein
VTGVQTCALPIYGCIPEAVLGLLVAGPLGVVWKGIELAVQTVTDREAPPCGFADVLKREVGHAVYHDDADGVIFELKCGPL